MDRRATPRLSRLLRIVLATVSAGGAFAVCECDARVATAFDLRSVPTDALIARLRDVTSPGIGTHPTARASGFLATDDEPRFDGGILGSAKPEASSVMRELVRRGCAALPELIGHLEDSRPTRMIVGRGLMGKWFGAEYDPRNRKSGKPPPGVQPLYDPAIGGRRFETYAVKVGDLCFVAIGQIVNRNLSAVRYQPSLCLVVNSPIESPALAAAVKADWAWLGAADHERSLENDALSPVNPPAEQCAVERLAFYYPDAGIPLAIRLLNREFYDPALAYRFFTKKLARSGSEAESDRLLREFREKHGDANFAGLLQVLRDASNFPESQMTPDRRREKECADRLLGRCPRGGDGNSAKLPDVVDWSSQKRLVEGLSGIRSKPVDAAILDVIRRLTRMPADEANSVFAQYDLAEACVKRLSGPATSDAALHASLAPALAAFRTSRPVGKLERGVAAIDGRLRKIQSGLES
ncbi:MAG: hypothetical protein PHC88_14625 [Terrimicrobiaceae bacterium]|nr:hypothetical protein [Terrimicrobiaceae bacterium]